MNPFIPKKRANLAIIAGNADEEILKSLKSYNIHIIKTIKCPGLKESVAYHPDMVIHPLDHKTLIIAPNVYEYYREVFLDFDFKLIKGKKFLSPVYPNNIAYNVARLSGVAIHNFLYTDSLLKDYLIDNRQKLINVKQGYSKCSIMPLDKGAYITSDGGIYKELVKVGYEGLLIEQGYICLPFKNYGFVGGASGVFSKKEVFFTGNLDGHPNKKEITSFLKRKNIKDIYLSKKPIMDLGSIFTFYCSSLDKVEEK